MLILSDSNSPHCFRRKFHGPVRIFFNDVEAKRIVEADDEAGYIVQARLDEHGHRVMHGDSYVYDRLEGAVRFEGIKRGDV